MTTVLCMAFSSSSLIWYGVSIVMTCITGEKKQQQIFLKFLLFPLLSVAIGEMAIMKCVAFNIHISNIITAQHTSAMSSAGRRTSTALHKAQYLSTCQYVKMSSN